MILGLQTAANKSVGGQTDFWNRDRDAQIISSRHWSFNTQRAWCVLIQTFGMRLPPAHLASSLLPSAAACHDSNRIN